MNFSMYSTTHCELSIYIEHHVEEYKHEEISDLV